MESLSGWVLTQSSSLWLDTTGMSLFSFPLWNFLNWWLNPRWRNTFNYILIALAMCWNWFWDVEASQLLFFVLKWIITFPTLVVSKCMKDSVSGICTSFFFFFSKSKQYYQRWYHFDCLILVHFKSFNYFWGRGSI